MLLWVIIIILLTISMIMTYYLFPNSPQIVMVHAYTILLVSLGILYRVYRKMRSQKTEKLVEELNYLRMKVAQLEGQIGTDEDIIEEESEI